MKLNLKKKKKRVQAVNFYFILFYFILFYFFILINLEWNDQ